MVDIHWSIGIDEDTGRSVCGVSGQRTLDEKKVTCILCLQVLEDLDAATANIAKLRTRGKAKIKRMKQKKSE